jgi:hypothetical protein
MWMTSFGRTLIGAATATWIAAIPVAAVAQDASNRTVEQYTCKEVMRESGSGRDTAIAFLHGFLLGKSGGSDVNLEAMAKQTDAFIDHCLDNPSDGAMDAMVKAKG